MTRVPVLVADRHRQAVGAHAGVVDEAQHGPEALLGLGEGAVAAGGVGDVGGDGDGAAAGLDDRVDRRVGVRGARAIAGSRRPSRRRRARARRRRRCRAAPPVTSAHGVLSGARSCLPPLDDGRAPGEAGADGAQQRCGRPGAAGRARGPRRARAGCSRPTCCRSRRSRRATRPSVTSSASATALRMRPLAWWKTKRSMSSSVRPARARPRASRRSARRTARLNVSCPSIAMIPLARRRG